MLKDNKNIYSAAAIGTLIGAGVAALFTTKAGCKILHKLQDGLDESLEMGSEYTHRLFDKNPRSFSGLSGKASEIFEESKEYVNMNTISGAGLGALLGAVAAIYLANQHGNERFTAKNIKEVASNSMENLKSFDWLETAHHIADILKGETCEKAGKVAKEFKQSSSVDDLIEVASLAYRLFKK
jgi:gas vesicle protein